MESHYSHRTVIASTRRQSQSREWQVVLAAAGIASTVLHEHGQWHLSVVAAEVERAQEELRDFQSENSVENDSEIDQELNGSDDVEHAKGRVLPNSRDNLHENVYPGAVVGVLMFLGVITFCQILQATAFGQYDWFRNGCMNAGDVRSGQWWRVVTALLLHRDTLHLMSNALFGTIFGYLAAKNIGGGAAWLAILTSGSLGNLMNAYTRPAEHTSVGVSTAVFGALGLLIAQAIRTKTTAISPWQRFSPLVGGLILFFYLGIGDEHTDTAAHFFGLISGLMIGACMRWIPNQFFRKTDHQVWLGIATLSIIFAAWSLATVAP